MENHEYGESTFIETCKYKEILSLYKQGKIVIGVDRTIARKYMDNYFLIPGMFSLLSLFISIGLSIYLLKWYSLLFIPLYLIIFLGYSGDSTRGNSNLHITSLVAICCVIVLLNNNYSIYRNCFSICFILSFWFQRFSYILPTIKFRNLILSNEEQYEKLKNFLHIRFDENIKKTDILPSDQIMIIKNIDKKNNDENINVLESLQCLGLDFVLKSSIFSNTKEIYYCSDFALFFTKINNILSFVFTKTVMYPSHYTITDEDKQKFLEFLQKCEIKSQSYDIYTLGIGAIKKNANNEEEKGEFVIGETYNIYLGEIVLLKTSSNDMPGVSDINPIKLSSVPDEYFLLSNLSCLDGKIINYRRLYSSHSEQTDHILDVWEINIERNNLIYRHLLYLDPYALKRGDQLNFENLPYQLVLKK